MHGCAGSSSLSVSPHSVGFSSIRRCFFFALLVLYSFHLAAVVVYSIASIHSCAVNCDVVVVVADCLLHVCSMKFPG